MFASALIDIVGTQEAETDRRGSLYGPLLSILAMDILPDVWLSCCAPGTALCKDDAAISDFALRIAASLSLPFVGSDVEDPAVGRRGESILVSVCVERRLTGSGLI